ncbi:MAG: hypothetical protein JWO86_3240 [Myxococcaceae bacterium]|jgi:hypothetical protein|nr:hypothetical protein [Myxococcaceae bacterium]MEA2745972.1 hypothetical protein [Myxococcales bacterium]
MPSSRLTVAFVLLAWSGAAGVLGACSDTDPRYGTPDAIRGRVIDYGAPAMTSTPTPEAGGAAVTPQQAFAAVYASVNGTCGSCHLSGTAGAPIFFGADEAGTYTKFKAAGYDKAGSQFYIKPAHVGPSLTAAQKALMDTWIAAEAAGGGTTTPPADAGGG